MGSLARLHKCSHLHLVSLRSCLTVQKGRRTGSSKQARMAALHGLNMHTWHITR